MEKITTIESDINDIVNRIQRDGVCVIKNYVNAQNLNLIDKEFENILNQYESKLDKGLGVNKCLRTNINSSILNSKNNSSINSLFTSTFIKNIADKILGKWKSDNIFIHKDFMNIHSNNTYPHFDYDRKLKFYLCLNDMNLDNGCFKALPNSIKLVEKIRKINRRNNIFTPGHQLYNGIKIKLEELIPIIANGGDLIIFDTNCIHAGGDKFVDGKFRQVIRLHLSN